VLVRTKAAAVAAALLNIAVVRADILPGFRAERVGTARGFVTSLVADSRGTLYYTTTNGTIFRVAGGESTVVATVTTEASGNSGLLGMALLSDRSAVVHYTTPRQTYDVLARVDLETGVETSLQTFVCDIDVPERGSSSEHHGGNPIVAPDGSIFVGIGDYGSSLLAALPHWNGGKIFKIAPNGQATQFALGVRNPFDMVWDDTLRRLIVADNGPKGGDEIHIIEEGADCGWPLASPGSVAPDYLFAETVAPTGMLAPNGLNTYFPRGLLLGTFVTRSLHYFTEMKPGAVRNPLTILEDEVGPVIDVTQTPPGEIYFATGGAIYRLVTPRRGDCDGDGFVTRTDYDALLLELADGEEPMTSAQDGKHRGSWGCDVNADGLISASDVPELLRLTNGRRRSVRR
jgi:glucose/arabinose dehydrogenase